MIEIPTSKLALVGYSVSFCVQDIVEGFVSEDQVVRIVAGTRCPDRAAFARMCRIDYAPLYWRTNPEAGIAVALRLWDADKIEQPRLQGREPHNIAAGHWVITKGSFRYAVRH